MKILVKKVKTQRQVATTSNESKSEIEGEPLPTYDEVAKSFERKDTGNQKEQTQPTARSKEDQMKETSKRPLSDSSNTPPLTQSQKKKNSVIDKELSKLFEFDDTDSSTEFDEIKPYANPCCYELIQKCTGRHFACACEQQYFKCKCGWKNIG